MYKFVCVLVLFAVTVNGAGIGKYTREEMQKCEKLSRTQNDFIYANKEVSRNYTCFTVCLSGLNAGVEWNEDGSINVENTVEEANRKFTEITKKMTPEEKEAEKAELEYGNAVMRNCRTNATFPHYCDKAAESMDCIFRTLGPKLSAV